MVDNTAGLAGSAEVTLPSSLESRREQLSPQLTEA